MLKNGHLEACKDFEHNGKTVKASLLGYRITAKFVRTFFGRVFNNPETVFSEAMLKPELQDIDTFIEGMNTIEAAHKMAAENYFSDDSIQQACPPLKALLHIMAYGHFENKTISSPEIRGLFCREAMLASDWYKERLISQQSYDVFTWKKHVAYLNAFISKKTHFSVSKRLGIESRLTEAKLQLTRVQSPNYLTELIGTLGRQPIEM